MHLGVLLLATSFVGWTASRGLDITDEGMYLLMSRHPEDVKVSLSWAHFYTKPLFILAGYQIAVFRMVGLLLTLLSGVAFAAGLLPIVGGIPRLARLNEQKLAVGAFVCLGAVLIYGWTLRSPNYNSLTSFSATSLAGCLLGALSLGERGVKYRVFLLLLTLSGMAIGVCFFCKFPAAAALLIVGVANIALWPGCHWRWRWTGFLSMLLGVVLWAAVHFLLFQPFNDWVASWKLGFAVWSVTGTGFGESPLHKLMREALSPFARAAWKFRALLFLLLAFLLLALFAPLRRRMAGVPLQILTSVVVVVLLAQSIADGFVLGGDLHFRIIMVFYTGVALIISLAIVLAATVSDPSLLHVRTGPDLRLPLLILLLAAMPFCAAAGTGNPIYLNTLLTMAPWFGLLAILLALLSTLVHLRLIFHGGTLLIAAIASSQIMTGYQVSPYRLHEGILQQTIITVVGDPETRVRLDEQTAQFIDTIRKSAYAAGFRPQDEVLALFNMPGLVYSLGGHSPTVAWYHAGYSGSKEINEFLISLVSHERLARAYILEKEGNPEAFPDLNRAGLDFPRQYRQVAEAIWPLTGQRVQLWKPLAQ